MAKMKRRTTLKAHHAIAKNAKHTTINARGVATKPICIVQASKDLPDLINKMQLSKPRAYRLKQSILSLESEPISVIRGKAKKLNLGTEKEVYSLSVGRDMSMLIGFNDDNSQIYLYDVIDEKH